MLAAILVGSLVLSGGTCADEKDLSDAAKKDLTDLSQMNAFGNVNRL